MLDTRFGTLLIIGALALEVLVACTSGNPERSPDRLDRPSLEETSEAVDYRDVVYRPPSFAADTERLASAAESLTTECMERRGFRYDGPATLVDRILGYAEPDMAYRRRAGYGIAHRYRPIYRPPRELSTDYSRAFFGDESNRVRIQTLAGPFSVPAEGCRAAAHTRVAGSPQEYYWAVTVPDLYWGFVNSAVANDVRWPPVASQWSGCMKTQGHSFAGPGDAVSSVNQQFAAAGAATDALRLTEIAVATADGQCQFDVRMPEIQRAIRRDFLRAAEPRFLRDLRHIARARTEALGKLPVK